MAASSAVLSMSKIIKPIWGGRLATTAKVFGAPVSSRREKSTVPPPAKYGGRHTVTLIPGDGIGPELLNHVRELFRFSCVPVDFEVVNVCSATEDDINNAITAIRRNGVALKGNIETLHTLPASHKSRNNLLRTTLDLYANVMHCKSLPGVQTRHNNIDIMIIRENTEGEYSSLEHESVSGVVECLKIITRTNSLRIAEYAFKLAREKGRKRVTAVHKAVQTDLGPGPGLVPGANYGRDYAVFETATRNTGKSIADRNIANPTAMLLASCMMLDHLKLYDYATMIRNAVLTTMNETQLHTADIGGQGTTSEVVQAIMRNIQSKGPLTSEL
uniref:Isocitrate dehydrogenase (NAD(+)) 3 non-catalytic subunit gamma n=1 Tax=Salmo trutta TaxID=8032 RepID=A0A674CYS8_SALTR